LDVVIIALFPGKRQPPEAVKIPRLEYHNM